MKCSECVAQGLRSTVTAAGGTTSTLIHCEPFYDEDGRAHHHDSNTSRTSYSCSNGHRWTDESGPVRCWCGWPEVEGGEAPEISLSEGESNPFQMDTAKIAERRNCGCFWLYLAAQPVVAPCAEHLAAIEGAVGAPAGAQVGLHKLKCPSCGCEDRKRFRATGQARGSYDDQVEVRCGRCGREWFSVSKIALELLRKQRDQQRQGGDGPSERAAVGVRSARWARRRTRCR